MQDFLLNNQKCIVGILLGMPVFLIAAPLIYMAIKRISRRFRISKNKDSIIKGDSVSRTLMKISFCLVLAVFMQRLMVLWYAAVDNTADMNFLEKAVEAFIHALKTLSIDEDYALFVEKGVEVVKSAFGEESWLVIFYRIMVSALNVVTPLAGGAVIFEVLTTVFPRLRLRFSHIRKSVYFFSELNERSLALAKSLYIDKNKATVVFTDTYLDDENEKTSELILQAKNIGAICINEDITRISFRFRREKKLFLIDEEELSNIRTLAALGDDGDLHGFKNMQIYVFCQDDSYTLLEQNITKTVTSRLEEKFKYREAQGGANEKTSVTVKEQEKRSPVAEWFRRERKKFRKKRYDSHKPVIVRMRDYENMVLNLLEKMPLFEPLTDCCYEKTTENGEKNSAAEDKSRKKKDFNITVFGTGKIGTQMILSATWCGQFYGYNLNINVISNESRESFVRRLDKISPEILKSTYAGSSLLRVYKDENKNIFADPYFRMRYLKCDIDNEIIKNMTCKEITENGEGEDSFNIVDSDYFVVALGSDEKNIAMAEELKRNLSRRALEPGNGKKAVIALSVFDHNLCKAFRKRSCDQSDVMLYAFGSRDETYDYKKITKVKIDPRDISADEALKEKERKKGAKTEEYRDRDKNQYNYMSDLARSIHLKYRMFSAYMFLEENRESACENWDITGGFSSLKAYDGYYETVLKSNVDSLVKTGPAAVDDVYNYLSWLEHRRWNAYTRSIGFVTRPDSVKEKNEKLRVHNCLAESEDYSLPGTGKETDMLDWALGRKPEDAEKNLSKPVFANESYEEKIAKIIEQRKKAFDKKYYDEPYEADGALIKWYSKHPKNENNHDEKEKKALYKPEPLNLEKVNLPESLEPLMEEIAKNVHENWAQLRISEGWTYGEKRDSDKKTTPCLVPYESLPENEKDYDRKTAEQTLKAIIALGYTITKE